MEDPELKEFVDSLTEEKYNAKIAELDLGKLRELAIQYNNTNPAFPINVDKYTNDKIGLVVSLWMRRVDIPQYLNLTWGSPYDESFKEYASIPSHLNNRPESYVVESNAVYNVLKYPDNLLGFIVGTMSIDPNSISKINVIFRNLGINKLYRTSDVYLTLKNMIPLSLAYFVIEGDTMSLFYKRAADYNVFNPNYPLVSNN